MTQFIVSGLGSAAIHPSLDNEVIVTVTHGHQLAILGLHDLATDRVLRVFLLVVVLRVRGVEVTVLLSRFNVSMPLAHLLSDLVLDFALHALVLTDHSSQALSRELTSAILCVVRGHDLLVRFAIDALICVVEHLALDRVFKVVMPLRDVRLRHGPDKA